jgi:hypothetical protein
MTQPRYVIEAWLGQFSRDAGREVSSRTGDSSLNG